jgi:hypothetical protein
VEKIRYCLFLIVVLLSALTYAGLPQIVVSPDTAIEVGEEVQFTIPLNINLNDTDVSVYEWDFGDGYFLKKGFPTSEANNTGPTCIHFFMKPGKFTVKAFKTINNIKDSTTTVVDVSGQSPISGFELWHAPFHARIGQYIYVKIPSAVTSYATNTLKITLTSSSGYSKVIMNKSSLNSEEKILLVNRELPKGNYVLTAELFKSDGSSISYVREKFKKPYDGIPTVGINENNALCINGIPTFAVTGFLLGKDELSGWAKNCVTAGVGEGYYPNHTLLTWYDYLTVSQSLGKYQIGPVQRWVGEGGFHNERNSNIEGIKKYVDATKDHPALLMWSWKDEPDLGGRDVMIPPPVFASWTYSSHTLDPNHPVWANLTGSDYLSYWIERGNTGTTYDYLGNEALYGGKKHFSVDFIGFDIYPLEYCQYLRLQNRRLMEEFAMAYDRLGERNYNLIPFSGFIETQEISRPETPAPTPMQIMMEAWITVVHGAKMVSWFHYFGKTPEANIAVMDQFNSQMKTFGNIILSAPSNRKISDDANVPGNRVDFIARDTIITTGGQTDTCTCVFAVRLTEPEGNSMYVNVNEPEKVSVTFSVSGINGKKVYDVNNNRWIQPGTSSFSDTLGKCVSRVYIISKNGLIKNAVTSTIRKPLIMMNQNVKINLKPFSNIIDIPLDVVPYVKVFNLSGKVVGRIQNNSTIKWSGKCGTGTYIFSDNKKFNLKLSLLK